jgi:hypothetical protein
MGHTTRISDYEMDRAWTVGPEVEGYDIEGQPAKKDAPEKSVTKSKVVEAEKKPAPKKSTARTKRK